MDGETRQAMMDIPLEQLRRFARNRVVDPKSPKQIELVESIREVGQTTAGIVRRVKGGYEVLAGERRWKALTALGRPTFRAELREDLADDDQAYRIALIENLQRDDLTAVEEGDAFNELLDGGRVAIDVVASKVGRSTSYVRERLRIRELLPELRELVDARKIDLGGALALAQCPPVAQKRVAKRLDGILKGQSVVSQSDIRSLLERENVTRSLDKVAWDLDDAGLVPDVGACTNCTQRTGEQRSLIADVVGKDDMCLDEVCFAGKSQAQWSRDSEASKKKGLKVLSAKESERIVQYGQAAYDSKYYAVDQHAYVKGKSGTAGEIAPDAARVIARDPQSGKAIELIEKKAVEQAAAKGGKSDSQSNRSKASAQAVKTRFANEATKQKEKAALDARIGRIALAEIDKAVAAKTLKLHTMLLKPLVRLLGSGLDGSNHVARYRGVKDSELEKLARELGGAKLVDDAVAKLALLGYQLHVAEALPDGYYVGDPKLAKDLGIDLEKIRKQATSELAAEKIAGKPAAAPPKKGKR